jgi:NAD dependent epimerase/dehydratase family enzyme
MADATILASARVVPARLQSDGFAFRYPELTCALSHILREKGK